MDEQAQQVLQQLDANTLEIVLTGFDLKNSRNPSAQLSGFVKSLPGGAGVMPVGGGRGTSTQERRRIEFIQRWALDDQAQQVLQQLDTATLEIVLTGFAPKNSRNPSAQLMGFVKSLHGAGGKVVPPQQETGFIASGEVDMEMFASFVDMWGFDAQAQEALHSLDSTAQQIVMRDFAPKNPVNVSAALMSFIKQVLGSGVSGGEHRNATIGTTNQPAWNVPKVAARVAPHDGTSGDPQVDEFVAMWGLDSHAQEMVMGLDDVARQRVITEFNPPPHARNMNAFFMRYAKITAGLEAPPPPASIGGPVATGDRQVDDFVEQWGLDGQCQKLLLGMGAETQQTLIKAFAPPEGTVSASRLFMTFAKNHVASLTNNRSGPYSRPVASLGKGGRFYGK